MPLNFEVHTSCFLPLQEPVKFATQNRAQNGFSAACKINPFAARTFADVNCPHTFNGKFDGEKDHKK